MKKMILLLLAALLAPSAAAFADGPYPPEKPKAVKPKAKAKKPRPKPTPLPKPAPDPSSTMMVDEELRAEEPPARFAPVPTAPVGAAVQEDLVTYSIAGTAMAVVTGDEVGAVPGIRLGARGPLAGSPFDIWATLQLAGSPGSTVDLTDVSTFKDGAFDATLGWKLASRRRGMQRVQTYLGVSGGFSTRLPSDPKPLDKFLRRFLIQLRIEELSKGAWLSLGLGRDDVAEGSRWRQLVWEGEIPVRSGTIDVIVGGRAVLTIFDKEGARDSFVTYVGGRWENNR